MTNNTKKYGKHGALIEMEPEMWESVKVLAKRNERSGAAQIRFFISEGLRLDNEEL
tara:strand:- start:8339 stop:8506 length:168 start_codon:yes stop_codon:yes gene_type:complete